MIKVTFRLNPDKQLGRLSEAERAAKLEAFDRLMPRIPGRTRGEVAAELDQVRSARRGGGRNLPAK